MGLVDSRDQRPLLREKADLGFFFGLWPMREHTIKHGDACTLSSLKERGTIDIHGVGFSYKRTFMENPNKTKPFCSLLSRRVFLRDRESVLHDQLLLVRSSFGFPLQIKTWLAPGFLPRPLP